MVMTDEVGRALACGSAQPQAHSVGPVDEETLLILHNSRHGTVPTTNLGNFDGAADCGSGSDIILSHSLQCSAVS